VHPFQQCSEMHWGDFNGRPWAMVAVLQAKWNWGELEMLAARGAELQTLNQREKFLSEELEKLQKQAIAKRKYYELPI
jgi:cell division protein FtsB